MAYPELPAHESNSELGAVWFAANYYFEASFKHMVEYNGWVFRNGRGKFQISGRRGKSPIITEVLRSDVPKGADPVAVWHTHLPSNRVLMIKDEQGRFVRGPDGKWLIDKGNREIAGFFDLVRGAPADAFSGPDRDTANILAREVWHKFGHGFALYICLATEIKRLRVGSAQPDGAWPKDPPARMARDYPEMAYQLRR
jgi:hypothetical protein